MVVGSQWKDFDNKYNWGISVCTSGTRPIVYDGRPIYETDTDKFLIHNGSSWIDISGGAAADHGSLLGLGDDDHTQYLLVNGTRSMTGNLTIDKSTPQLVLSPTDSNSPGVMMEDSSSNLKGSVYVNSGEMVVLCEDDNLYLATKPTTGGDILIEPKGVTRLTVSDAVITSTVDINLGTKKLENGRLELLGAIPIEYMLIGQPANTWVNNYLNETNSVEGRHYTLAAEMTDGTSATGVDGDKVAIFGGVKTNTKLSDVWAANFMVVVDHAATNADGIEVDVNTSQAGVGNGVIITGAGTAKAQYAIGISMQNEEWNWGLNIAKSLRPIEINAGAYPHPSINVSNIGSDGMGIQLKHSDGASTSSAFIRCLNYSDAETFRLNKSGAMSLNGDITFNKTNPYITFDTNDSIVFDTTNNTLNININNNTEYYFSASELEMYSNRISGLGTPTQTNDATPKWYVDTSSTNRHNDYLNFNSGYGARYDSNSHIVFFSSGTVQIATDLYVVGTCSAESFTDRTPFYVGDAIKDIKQIKGDANGIDHATLPEFVKATTVKTEIVDGIEVEMVTDERNLGNMISILTVAVQQLTDRIEELEAI